MKKLLVTILALVYLGSSTGAVMHLHYCMGKLAETSFSKNTNTTCSKCGMTASQKKGGCCKDETKFVKNEQDQKASLTQFEFQQLAIAFQPLPYFHLSTPELSNQLLIAYASNAPPDIHAPAVYLRVCSFLI
ncbi:MAG TPA: hypothetical protein PLK14_07845 [Sediminibacterium sp.]|nr:hypothetical protein [Sediminibacterium sp.]HQS55006.1 hypothetical protein [Sediminibacterium sp.]